MNILKLKKYFNELIVQSFIEEEYWGELIINFLICSLTAVILLFLEFIQRTDLLGYRVNA